MQAISCEAGLWWWWGGGGSIGYTLPLPVKNFPLGVTLLHAKVHDEWMADNLDLYWN